MFLLKIYLKFWSNFYHFSCDLQELSNPQQLERTFGKFHRGLFGKFCGGASRFTNADQQLCSEGR
jgi:hypothetical protein